MTITEDDVAAFVVPPFKAPNPPLCRSEIQKRYPQIAISVVDPLANIWDEVVHRIIGEMLTLSQEDPIALHINVREDMAFELAQLMFWLGGLVIEKRAAGRDLNVIDVAEEREACFGAAGEAIITGTARMAYDHIWKRKMDERWKPKSAKAAEREANPRRATLAVKPVGKNHFIPRWFIRDNWAVDGKVLRWRRAEAGWMSARRGFGEWGYRHNLYSDQLEAYFSLLEGDAKRPIQMLLDTIPLNEPQRDALVGFLVIQLLRNPQFIDAVHRGIAPAIAQEGYADDAEMPSKAYESMFKNNKLYHQLAHPVMWSRWAIVKASSPTFVLPDTFGVRGTLDDGLRIIAPLTPNVCFVTLPHLESQKRIVPHCLSADEALAERISAALVNASTKEFLSHPDFKFQDAPSPVFRELLNEIEQAVTRRPEYEEQSMPRLIEKP